MSRQVLFLFFSFVAVFGWSPSFAMSNDDLKAELAQRFKDDRTGSTVAAGSMTTAPLRRLGIARIQRPSGPTTSTPLSRSAPSPKL